MVGKSLWIWGTGGIVVDKGNGSTGRKSCLSAILCITYQMQQGLASDRTQVSAVIKAYVFVVGCYCHAGYLSGF